MVVSEIRLSINRTINLGNYENVKIEAGALVSRTADDDTAEGMRFKVLDEIALLMKEAEAEYIPNRRRHYKED